LGVGMILKMAQEVNYRETFGMNNLIITIEKKDKLKKSNRHTKNEDNQNEQR
jgi:hypothetical protein